MQVLRLAALAQDDNRMGLRGSCAQTGRRLGSVDSHPFRGRRGKGWGNLPLDVSGAAIQGPEGPCSLRVRRLRDASACQGLEGQLKLPCICTG
jgi:hypothetical protein